MIKGIIMSADSVRAIREGRKTQTRRVIKPPRGPFLWDFSRAWVDPGVGGGPYLKVPFCHESDGWQDDPDEDTVQRIRSPHQPGDVLYVKETWAGQTGRPLSQGHLFYRADGDDTGKQLPLSYVERESRWRSPLHMPRWAAREWLRVTEVRAQRVQDIGEEDARTEVLFVPGVANPWVWSYTFERIEKPEDE